MFTNFSPPLQARVGRASYNYQREINHIRYLTKLKTWSETMNMMSNIFSEKDIEISALYAQCIQTSNRMNWHLDENKISKEARIFDVSQLFLLNKLQDIKE
jgi:hypothetical protein